MKSLLEQVEPIDSLVGQLSKVESKLKQGQIIDAHRDVCRIRSVLEKYKKELLENE